MGRIRGIKKHTKRRKDTISKQQQKKIQLLLEDGQSSNLCSGDDQDSAVENIKTNLPYKSYANVCNSEPPSIGQRSAGPYKATDDDNVRLAPQMNRNRESLAGVFGTPNASSDLSRPDN